MDTIDFFQAAALLEEIREEMHKSASKRSPEEVEKDVIDTLTREGGTTSALKKRRVREKLKAAEKTLGRTGGRFKKIDARQIHRILQKAPKK
jgi:hypothetical protein